MRAAVTNTIKGSLNALPPLPPTGGDDLSLDEIRRRVYPRAVSGLFARWRVALVLVTQCVFYGLPWLTWNGSQMLLFDLGSRKFHVFGRVFWPQDVIYLAVLLILCPLALFLFTAVAGRLWCGYACPQTIYTQVFLWIERRVEGDRLARIRLDAAPWSAGKFARRAAKHGAWFAIALWTGYTFVGYFAPIRDLGARAVTADVGGWEAFWILFYGFATYGNAGWMREQVCKYMCPYARLQSVMFDRDTLVIAYDPRRGEPRGARSRGADPRALGLGDCIDCRICVQVCPTGIDIRRGLQHDCIGCAACVDGCNRVMEKLGYARGLIRYTSENGLARGYDRHTLLRRMLRPRSFAYAVLVVAIAGAAAFALATKRPMKMEAMPSAVSDGRYAGRLAGITPGHWRVVVETLDSRLGPVEGKGSDRHAELSGARR